VENTPVNNDHGQAVTDRTAEFPKNATPKPMVLKPDGISALIDLLKKQGYCTIAPQVRNGAIVLEEIEKGTDLPIGWQDSQDGGKYHLKHTKAKTIFGFNHGPHSWKRWLHSSGLCLWKAKSDGTDFKVQVAHEKQSKYAFIGVRSCELRAIEIQDNVFLNSQYKDSYYQRHREGNFIVAVNCSRGGGTCFCVSTDSGPRVKSGYDLVLTEVHSGSTHHFLVEVGTKRGAEVIANLPTTQAENAQIDQAAGIVTEAARQMGRVLETRDIKQLLYRNLEHPRWAEVASRCLTCGNCTLVCPTCFCTTVEDVTDLTGTEAERWRRWDSCFTMDFSYIHGGSVRTSHGMRYRQWLTHKLASWQDQFGSLGCVGCGRCITWCPVGIDITEEARAIRESDSIDPMANKGKE
jgi:sulfhydrogenase subunit beta (sulfur reductase)